MTSDIAFHIYQEDMSKKRPRSESTEGNDDRLAIAEKHLLSVLQKLDIFENELSDSLKDKAVDGIAGSHEEARDAVLQKLADSVMGYQNSLVTLVDWCKETEKSKEFPDIKVPESYYKRIFEDNEHFTNPEIDVTKNLLELKDQKKQLEHADFIFRKVAEGIQK